MSSHLKKTMIVTFVSLFSPSIFAQPYCPCYDGFYLGANIGIGSLLDHESTSVPIHDVHYLSNVGVIGGGLLGYDLTLSQHWKLGIEGFLNVTDLSISTNQNYSPQATYDAQMNYEAGIRFLPGYELTPGTVLHIILGYVSGSFTINDNGNYGFVDSKFSKNGYQGGVGMKAVVSDNVIIRADMIYTSYASQTNTGHLTSSTGSIQKYNNNFSTFFGNLALIYKFS